MNTMRQRPGTFIGVILVALGLAAFASVWFAFPDAFIAGSVALALLLAYLLSREYLFLVFGMIGAGAALGTGLQDYGYDEKGGLVAIFSGAGFLAVYLVDVLAGTSRRWWPIVPGSILVLIGGLALAQGTDAEQWIEKLWPIALVIAGIVVVLVSRYSRPTATPIDKPLAS